MFKCIEVDSLKYAIFSDIHFGKSKDSVIKLRTTVDFIKWFVKQCDDNKVDAIIFGGDWFDNRTNINVATLNIAYDYLKLIATKYVIYMIVGNHDSTLKNTIKVNSLNHFKDITNVVIIDEPTILKTNEKEVLLCPWDTDIKLIDKYYDCIVGHFEFAGAETAGIEMRTGDVTINDLTKNVPIVFSGHFHIRKEYPYGDRKLITIGSPFELDWGDYGNKKGAYIYDLNNRSYEFIENTQSPIHVKLYWSKIKSNPDEMSETIVRNNYIKVIVDEEFVYSDLTQITNNINQLNPIKHTETDFMFTNKVDQDLKDIDVNLDIEIKMSNIDYIRRFIYKMDDKFFNEDITKDKLCEIANQYHISLGEKLGE